MSIKITDEFKKYKVFLTFTVVSDDPIDSTYLYSPPGVSIYAGTSAFTTGGYSVSTGSSNWSVKTSQQSRSEVLEEIRTWMQSNLDGDWAISTQALTVEHVKQYEAEYVGSYRYENPKASTYTEVIVFFEVESDKLKFELRWA